MCVRRRRREVGKRSPMWLLRIHDFMQALQHNFEQLHISQETVISIVSTRNLIIKSLPQNYHLSNHSSFPDTNFSTWALLSSPTPSNAPEYQEHSQTVRMHRSHSNPVLEVYVGVNCQCLSIETFPGEKASFVESFRSTRVRRAFLPI